jgi:RNA polymerase sigma factor (sigma-70 family)
MTAAIKVGRVSAAADLAQFCQAQYPRLVGTLALYCGDRLVAEELAQETLARVCAQWARVGAMTAPAGWTHRVAMNLANSRFRRLAAERRAKDRAEARSHTVDDPADLADAVAIRAAVSALPARQKTALVLRYYADLPVEQVATHLRTSAGAVHQLTHRALETLRSTFDVTEDAALSLEARDAD